LIQFCIFLITFNFFDASRIIKDHTGKPWRSWKILEKILEKFLEFLEKILEILENLTLCSHSLQVHELVNFST